MSLPGTRRRSTTHTASRAKSTASAPASYFGGFSTFTNPYATKPTKSSSTKDRTSSRGISENAVTERGFFDTRASSTSAYKRSPRQGWFARMYAKIRRLIRKFVQYARAHPFKILIPLVTAIMGSGALAGLVSRMGGLEGLGLNLPGLSALKGVGIDRWINAGHGVRQGYDGFSGRGGMEREDVGGGYDSMGMLRGGLKVASAFL